MKTAAVLFAAILLVAVPATTSRAELFACVGPDGKKSYTTNPRSPGCKQSPSYEPGAKNSHPSPSPAKPAPDKPAAKSGTSGTPAVAIPRVSPKTQAVRDSRRRLILAHELRREINTRDSHRRRLALADDEKIRDFLRRLVRVHNLNILAIRREMELLGENPPRN